MLRANCTENMSAIGRRAMWYALVRRIIQSLLSESKPVFINVFAYCKALELIK